MWSGCAGSRRGSWPDDGPGPDAAIGTPVSATVGCMGTGESADGPSASADSPTARPPAPTLSMIIGS